MFIRDLHPDDLFETGLDHHQVTTELLSHGHHWKAALVIRRAVRDFPGFREEVLACIRPKELARELLDGNLMRLPGSPREF